MNKIPLLLAAVIASCTPAMAAEHLFFKSDDVSLYIVGESFRYGNRKAAADFTQVEKATGNKFTYTVIVDSDACMGKYEGRVFIAEDGKIVLSDYWSGGSRHPRVIDLQSMLVCKTYQKAINLRWY